MKTRTGRIPARWLAAIGVALALLTLQGLARGDTGGTPGRTITVGTKVVKPFAWKTADGKWTGISIDLFEEMNRDIGYEIVWTEAPSTNDLIDRVAAHEIDIAVAAITMTPQRAERVDFTNSMYKSGLGIAVRAEPEGTLAALGGLLSAKVLGGVAFFLGVLIAIGRRNDLRDQIDKALLHTKTNGRLDEITQRYLGER